MPKQPKSPTLTVKAKKDFNYSPDGITIVSVEEGDVFTLDRTIFNGLQGGEYVEEVQVKAEEVKVPEADKALSASATLADRQPDISPIEHGGETLDRILTKEGQQPTDPKRDEPAETMAEATGAKAVKGYEDKADKAAEENKAAAVPDPQADQAADDAKRGRKAR